MNVHFHIIELLVVITIVSVFFGAVTVNFARQQRTYELKSALNDLTSIVELARTKAVSGEVPSSCDYDSFKGYSLLFVGDLSDPSITLNSYCDTEAIIKTFELSKYEGLQIIDPPAKMYFQKIYGYVRNWQTDTRLEPDETIIIKLKSNLKQDNQWACLVIDSFGFIRTHTKDDCVE